VQQAFYFVADAFYAGGKMADGLIKPGQPPDLTREVHCRRVRPLPCSGKKEEGASKVVWCQGVAEILVG
jgi:hypothetical protein